MTLIDVLQTRKEYAKSLAVTEFLSIDNPSGPGQLEVGGSSNAYIDLKSPFSDDFDVRLGTIGGTSATLETANNQPLAISSGSGNVNIQPNASGKVGIGVSSPTEKLHVAGRVLTTSLLVDTSSNDGVIEVSGSTGAYIDLKSPASDDNDIRLGTTGSGGYLHTTNANLTIAALGSGKLRLSNLPIYATNAAAITGGLVADDVYKTATGELRIVV